MCVEGVDLRIETRASPCYLASQSHLQVEQAEDCKLACCLPTSTGFLHGGVCVAREGSS